MAGVALAVILGAVTMLLCYAGYIFLIVDRRQASQELEDPETFAELDDKNYDFYLPEEADTYEELRISEPADKRTLPMALLDRAKADIPMIEQLEKDHPRMARLFQKGLLPFGIWEQLLEAEAIMDAEVHQVQAEAERLQKGWGQGVFSQAYQMLRKDREDEVKATQLQKDQCVLTITFTKPSGGQVTVRAEGRKVTAQTQMVIGKEAANEGSEISALSEVLAELVSGGGEDEKKYSCTLPELTLDAAQDKQWKQIGSDPAGLRLQVKFVRRTTGARAGFVVADVRATLPESASTSAVGPA